MDAAKLVDSNINIKRNRGLFMEGESKKFLLISFCHAWSLPQSKSKRNKSEIEHPKSEITMTYHSPKLATFAAVIQYHG